MRTHSEEEDFRATLATRTLDGDQHTLIVTRRSAGSAAQVWLTLDGAWKTTVALTNPETAQLIEFLTRAMRPYPAP